MQSAGGVPVMATVNCLLARASAEAERAAALSVGPDHLLLAMLDEETGVTARLLDAAGVDRERLRRLLQPPRQLVKRRREMLEARAAKVEAVRVQDYEQAAEWRDTETRLIPECAELEAGWREGRAAEDDPSLATD